MILTYTGTGETVPVLGGRYVAPGEAVHVRDKHVQGLLATKRWHRPDERVKRAQIIAELDAEEFVPESFAPVLEDQEPRRKKRKVAGGEPDATGIEIGSTETEKELI